MTAVALVHYAAAPVVGGVESVIGSHAGLMAAAGHDVRIVAGRGDPSGQGIRFDRIELIDPRNPVIEGAQAELNAGRIPRDFEDLVRQIRGQLEAVLAGSDVVICHNVCSLGLNLALTAALRSIADEGQPGRFIAWHHDLAATSPDYLPSLHPGRPWDLLREAWPGVRNVVVSAARQRDLTTLTGLPAAAIEVVPNGLDISRVWRLSPRVAALRAELDSLGVDRLLLVPARIMPRKNLELALRVVAAMRLAGQAAGLIVTGPVDPHRPAEEAYLARLVELRSSLGLDGVVRFLATEPDGPPSDVVMDEIYRLADVVLLPSRDEGFGLPLLEAGVDRVPVVCSDLPVLHEIAGDEATYFDPDDDPERIAETIVALLASDPAWRLRRRVRSDYAWPRIYATSIEPLLSSSVSA